MAGQPARSWGRRPAWAGPGCPSSAARRSTGARGPRPGAGRPAAAGRQGPTAVRPSVAVAASVARDRALPGAVRDSRVRRELGRRPRSWAEASACLESSCWGRGRRATERREPVEPRARPGAGGARDPAAESAAPKVARRQPAAVERPGVVEACRWVAVDHRSTGEVRPAVEAAHPRVGAVPRRAVEARRARTGCSPAVAGRPPMRSRRSGRDAWHPRFRTRAGASTRTPRPRAARGAAPGFGCR